MKKNKREYSNIILLVLFVLSLVSVGSEKAVPNLSGGAKSSPIVIEDMLEMTMPERLIVIEEFIEIAIEDSEYERDELLIEYYPENQKEGLVTIELLSEEDEIFLGYHIDAESMEVVEVERGEYIPYVPPTEYGEGYQTPEECVERALEYSGFEYDEVEGLEISDYTEGDKSYRVTWIAGDYWYHIIQDAKDGRIRDVERQLVE